MFFRAGSTILIISVLEKLVLMFAYILIARTSSIESIGLLALVILIVEGFVFLGNFGVNERVLSKKTLPTSAISLYKGLNDVFCICVFITSSVLLPLVFLVLEKYSLLLLYLPVSVVPALAILSRFFVGWMSYHSMYSQQATRKLYAGVAGSLTAIVSALIGFGIYSIIISKIIYALTDLLLVQKFFPKDIKFRISFRFMRAFSSFSLKVTMSQALNYANGKIYELFFLTYFGITALGLVDVAKRITATLTRTILTPLTNIINSKVIRSSNTSEQYTIIVLFLISILCPGFIFLLYMSEFLIITLFTERYIESIELMQVFCLISILQILLWFSSSLIIKVGKPFLLISNQLINTTTTALAVVTSILMQIDDLLSFMKIALFMILISTFLRFAFLTRKTELSMKDAFTILFSAFIVSFSSYFAIKLALQFFPEINLFTIFVLIIVVSLVILTFVTSWFYLYRNKLKDV